jgi:hypothetical protein
MGFSLKCLKPFVTRLLKIQMEEAVKMTHNERLPAKKYVFCSRSRNQEALRPLV